LKDDWDKMGEGSICSPPSLIPKPWKKLALQVLHPVSDHEYFVEWFFSVYECRIPVEENLSSLLCRRH